MNISVGIVGLPNVGKSTLFNALLKKQVAYAANYPFATIEPNKGIVEVPDARLAKLAEIVNTQTIIPAAVEFYDIAGLVKGASQGEGLGNQFLSHIREVSVIVHVVRFFDDEGIIHVAQNINPIRDIEIINTELILADLQTLEKQREPKGNASDEEKLKFATVHKLILGLNKGFPAHMVSLTEEEASSIKDLHLITLKPVIFVCNISEKALSNMPNTIKEIEQALSTIYPTALPTYIPLCIKLENDIAQVSQEEVESFLSLYQLEDTGLNKLIKTAYKTLGLISYLTAGEKEVRAWTIRQGTMAPQAAGEIHTDFEKKFIKADIVTFNDFVACNGWVGAREKGKVISAGKDYIMKDGDIVEFKIGA